jgi:hypothetical protein
MPNKYNLVVGQKLWLTGKGDKELTEVIVSSVGNKFFKLESFKDKKYDLTTLRRVSEYTIYDRLYLSKKEYNEESLKTHLNDELQKVFGGHKQLSIGLDKMKRLADILEIPY